jgi:hypothetical protein
LPLKCASASGLDLPEKLRAASNGHRIWKSVQALALLDLLDQGVVWIQYRTENVHILPVFGKGALNASPRVGHLHVHVDDLPWWWADASDNNTIDLAGMPPGPHKVRIELVDANHEVFPGQSKTVTFIVAGPVSHRH